MAPKKPVGWRKEPARHGLAAKGIKTGNKRGPSLPEYEGLAFWAGKDRTYFLRKYPDPGKFEGGFFIDQYVYEMAMDADVIGEVSLLRLDTERRGWEYGSASAYATMGKDALEFIEDALRNSGESWPGLTHDEREFILNMAGVIATETDQGFVDTEYFETKKEFDQAIVNLEDQWEKFYAEQEGEDV